MKNKILKTLLFFVLFSALFVTASFATTNYYTSVKEDVSTYESTTYIIGSTRIDADMTITAGVAMNAGYNDAKVKVLLNQDIFTTKPAMYSYDTDFEEWNLVNEDGTTKLLNSSEVEELEDNLNIFFVNDEVKKLKVPYSGSVDEIYCEEDENFKVTHDGENFIVPAWTFWFDFESNGDYVTVETNVDTNILEGKEPTVEKVDIIPSGTAITVGKEFFEADQLKEAIEKSTPENEVKLWDVIELDSSIVLEKENMNSVLNLNGWSITTNTGNYVIELKAPNSVLTVKNGNINGYKYGALKADSKDLNGGSVTINIEETAQVYGADYGLVIFGDKTIANVKGRIQANNTNGYAISGNGNKGWGGTTLNISGNASICAYEGIAIYIPQEGITNISGQAYITGKTAIAMKAGELNVTGGTLNGMGELIQIPEETNDGTNPTGDAIYVESNKGYAGNVKINIEGKNTDLYSNYGLPVRVYKSNSNDDITITGKYTTTHIISDKMIGYDDLEATMTVGNTKYGYEPLSLATAIMSSSKENPAKLLADVWVEETINLNSTKSFDAVVDLGKNVISGNKENYVIVLEAPNSSLTIDNGGIHGYKYAAIKATSKDLTKDSTVTLNVGEDATLQGVEYGLIIFGNGYKSNVSETATLEEKATAIANIKGTISSTDPESYAISGNGNPGWGGTCINISGDKANVISENGVGIYLPQEGIANISGGTISGITAIATKAGTLNITGGQLIANGASISNEQLLKDGDGTQTTGDIIYVECNDGYADQVKINVNVELVEDNDSNVIRVFKPADVNNEVKEVKGIYATANETTLDNGAKVITYTK